MTQAFHGGGVHRAAEQFGLPSESFVDFSSNLNVLAPGIAAVDWERWMTEIYRYPEPADLTRQLASFYEVEGELILPTAGAIEALYLSPRLLAGRKSPLSEPTFRLYTLP